MNEVENFKAAKESLADVAARAGHGPGSGDVLHRMVEAAVYRATHQPQPTTEDEPPAETAGTE